MLTTAKDSIALMFSKTLLTQNKSLKYPQNFQHLAQMTLGPETRKRTRRRRRRRRRWRRNVPGRSRPRRSRRSSAAGCGCSRSLAEAPGPCSPSCLAGNKNSIG